MLHDHLYSTVGCRRTGGGGGRQSQPGSFLFFTTPANLVLIFQSVFKTRRLACSAHTVCDDARRRSRSRQYRRRSRLHSKRSLRVVKPSLTHFSSLGSFFFLDEFPAWPFFGTRQCCSVLGTSPGLRHFRSVTRCTIAALQQSQVADRGPEYWSWRYLCTAQWTIGLAFFFSFFYVVDYFICAIFDMWPCVWNRFHQSWNHRNQMRIQPRMLT